MGMKGDNRVKAATAAEQLGLDEHIICPICLDYLSDAVTITRCLHSFCRKCLTKRLIQNASTSGAHRCPKCLTDLGSEPNYRRDPKLQEMVYKLVPDLFWRQLRKAARRRRRHRSSGSNSTPSERRIEQQRQLVQISSQLCSPNEEISLQIDYVPLGTVLAANIDGGTKGEETDSPPTKERHSFQRFLLCPAKVRIEHLKKLLESKLAMTDSYGVYFVDPQLRNVLEDEHTLEDLVQMFGWTRDGPLQLRFTLARFLREEEEDRPPVLEEMPQLDVESGPMEQPIEAMQRAKEGKAAENKEKGKGGGKKGTCTTTANGKGKKNEVPSPSVAPAPPPSLTSAAHKMPLPPSSSASPPASAMPRLSTAGVSPLRPVPSLIGNLVAGPSISQQQPTTTAKKRKRTAKKEEQPPEKAQKVEGENMTKEKQQQQLEDAPSSSPMPTKNVQQEMPSLSDEGENGKMVKRKEEGKIEAQQKPNQQKQQNPIGTAVAATTTTTSGPESGSGPISMPQKTPLPKTAPKRQRPPAKSKQPANLNQQQSNTSSSSFAPSSSSSSSSITFPSAPPSVGVGTPASPPILLPPPLHHPHQYATLPTILRAQSQQQYVTQFMQNIFRNSQENEALGALATIFQGISAQQVQAMQQMLGGMAAMAGVAQEKQQKQTKGTAGSAKQSNGADRVRKSTTNNTESESGEPAPRQNGAKPNSVFAKKTTTPKMASTSANSHQQHTNTSPHHQLPSSSSSTTKEQTAKMGRMMGPPSMVPTGTTQMVMAALKATMPS